MVGANVVDVERERGVSRQVGRLEDVPDHVLACAVGQADVHRGAAVAGRRLDAVGRYVPEAVGERVVVDLLDQVRVPGAVAEHPFGVRLAEVPDGGGADVGVGVAIDVRGERGGAGCLHSDRQLRLHAGVLAQARERVVLDLGSGNGRAGGADVDPVGAARVVDEVALDL